MDSQQQFCLKWNSFGSNLATTFGNLFRSESLTDVTLFCEGVTFKAHKLILAACSKHFQDLFETAPVCPSVLVILDGTSSSNMSALLEFMYKGEVHVSQDSLSSFLKAAECLQVKGLSIEHEKLAVVHSSQASSVNHDSQLDSPTNRKQSKLNSCISKESHEGNTTEQTQQQQQQPQHQQPPPPPPPPPPPSQQQQQQPQQHHHHQTQPQTQPQQQLHQQHPSTSSYTTALYMHPSHYRYEQRVPLSPSHYDAPPPRKRHHRSSSEAMQDAAAAAAVRASVLRDGSKPSGKLSPLSLAYRPSGSQQQNQQQPPPPPPPPEPELKSEPDKAYVQSPHHMRYDSAADPNPAATPVTYDRTAAVDVDSADPVGSETRRSSVDTGSSCPEDLRVKLEISGSHSEDQHTSSTALYADTSAEQTPEMIPINVWNSGANMKVSPQKGSSIATADGKKLKCPFCERLYGYETNLRAHIRQRHQGIRVPCPFCSRTFTRNNTVRRHIAREHKTEYSLKVFQQAQVHNHNNQ